MLHCLPRAGFILTIFHGCFELFSFSLVGTGDRPRKSLCSSLAISFGTTPLSFFFFVWKATDRSKFHPRHRRLNVFFDTSQFCFPTGVFYLQAISHGLFSFLLLGISDLSFVFSVFPVAFFPKLPSDLIFQYLLLASNDGISRGNR